MTRGSVWFISGLVMLATLLLMACLAKLYRKAGPHEASSCMGSAAPGS